MFEFADDSLNPGTFHFVLTLERLTQAHESRPWNPLIAQVLYRAGIIERWGTGTLNIIDWCRENHAPVPIWEERAGSVVITFLPAVEFEEDFGGQTHQYTMQDPDQYPVHVNAEIARLLSFCMAPISRKDLMDLLGLHHLPNFRQVYLQREQRARSLLRSFHRHGVEKLPSQARRQQHSRIVDQPL